MHELVQGHPLLLVDAVPLDERNDRHAAAEAGGADNEEDPEYLPQGDLLFRFHCRFYSRKRRCGQSISVPDYFRPPEPGRHLYERQACTRRTRLRGSPHPTTKSNRIQSPPAFLEATV